MTVSPIIIMSSQFVNQIANMKEVSIIQKYQTKKAIEKYHKKLGEMFWTKKSLESKALEEFQNEMERIFCESE